MRFLSATALLGAPLLLAPACEEDPPDMMMMMMTDTEGTSTGGSDSGDIEGPEANPELDEDFDDDGDLDEWEILNPDSATLEIDGGQLHIEPVANSLWFNGSSGVLVYKLIAGDFVVSTPARARQSQAPQMPPEIQFRLGGLMARAPEEVVQNYVFGAVGADGDDISFETKSTVDSASSFDGPSWDESGDAEIRICRIGSNFRIYARVGQADPWLEQAEFSRPDLPDVLQVGLIAYANDVNPNLRVSFDEVTFVQPQRLADCTR